MARIDSAQRPRGASIVGTAVAVAAAACLAVTLVGAGFAACAVPDATTRLLAQATSNDADSPFSKDELIEAAVVTKDYTVGTHDGAALEAELRAVNEGAGTRYADSDDIFNAPEEYTLTADAISHLDDVHSVVSTAEIVLSGVAVACLACLVACAATGGRRRVGGALVGAGVAVIACFAALGAWAAFDFDGLFSAMHALFFAAGTWTFSFDSLLICMYPIGFWMGMGAVWLAVTAMLSILAIVVGALLRCRRA